MNAEIKFTGCTPQVLREIAAALSRRRDDIATYNGSGTIADHCAIRVTCEGPSLFTVVTPVVPASVARDLLHEIDVRPQGGETS